MVDAAILLANFVVTGVVFVTVSFVTHAAWKDRGIDWTTEDDFSLDAKLVLSSVWIVTLLAFWTPASQVISLILGH